MLCLFFTVCVCACSALGGAVEPVKWPDVVQCVPDATELVGEVSEVLLGGEQVADKLTDLARKHSPKTVVCVVNMLISKWQAPGASASPQRAQGAEAGAKFLSEIGTQVAAPE
jgi:hypothetical protein